MQKKVLVIAGPTGVGESTITRKIIEKFPIFKRLVTATTRAPRGQEQDGQDYYFFDKARFQEELTAGNILEHTYIENRDVYYGSFKPDLEQKISQGLNVITNTDLIGARYYKKNYNAITIFILPDSIENLKKRHIARGTESEEEMKKRLEYAIYEIENESSFYDYRIINKQDCLAETVEEITKIIKNEGYNLSQN